MGKSIHSILAKEKHYLNQEMTLRNFCKGMQKEAFTKRSSLSTQYWTAFWYYCGVVNLLSIFNPFANHNVLVI